MWGPGKVLETANTHTRTRVRALSREPEPLSSASLLARGTNTQSAACLQSVSAASKCEAFFRCCLTVSGERVKSWPRAYTVGFSLSLLPQSEAHLCPLRAAAVKATTLHQREWSALVADACATAPVSDACATAPVSDACVTAPVSDACVTAPVSDACATTPSSKACYGLSCNARALGNEWDVQSMRSLERASILRPLFARKMNTLIHAHTCVASVRGRSFSICSSVLRSAARPCCAADGPACCRLRSFARPRTPA